MIQVTLDGHSEIVFGDGRTPVLIAGPCVIETGPQTLEIAAFLKELAAGLGVPLVFKASFDKANRTSVQSYRGPGLNKGLEILGKAADMGLAVTTDIHRVDQAGPVAEVVDMIQIPAFLCRQTDLVTAAAETGKAVNIKKGQFMAPDQMGHIVDKARLTGNQKVLVTERGTFFGYRDLVVDFRSLVHLKSLGIPVIYDATHSVQAPGGEENRSGGHPEFIVPLARAASAVGIQGLFVETHPDPDRAKSDAAVQVPLRDMKRLVTDSLKTWRAVWAEE